MAHEQFYKLLCMQQPYSLETRSFKNIKEELKADQTRCVLKNTSNILSSLCGRTSAQLKRCISVTQTKESTSCCL